MNARVPFLARGEYDQDARDEAIVLRAEKLMERGAYCDPLSAENLDEALSETLAAYPVKNDFAAKLAAALLTGEPVNKLLTALSEAYWHPMALSRAEDELEDERELAIEARAEDRRDHEREERGYWAAH